MSLKDSCREHSYRQASPKVSKINIQLAAKPKTRPLPLSFLPVQCLILVPTATLAYGSHLNIWVHPALWADVISSSRAKSDGSSNSHMKTAVTKRLGQRKCWTISQHHPKNPQQSTAWHRHDKWHTAVDSYRCGLSARLLPSQKHGVFFSPLYTTRRF